MESNPLRGLFGVSSPRPVEQRVAPQPSEPTENENENVCFEIPSGMIEKLLANPFAGDGTTHRCRIIISLRARGNKYCGRASVLSTQIKLRKLVFY